MSMLYLAQDLNISNIKVKQRIQKIKADLRMWDRRVAVLVVLILGISLPESGVQYSQTVLETGILTLLLPSVFKRLPVSRRKTSISFSGNLKN